MFVEKKDYQRTFLRAPYKEPILYIDDNFVFKASSLNLSEGGLLLDQVPHFPEESEDVPIILSLPQFPYLKNYTLEKLHSFSADIFPKKVIRLKCKMVRKIGIKSRVDEVFTSQIGLKFTDVDPLGQKVIQEYVNVFASNIIYLQVLIDSLHADKKNLEKIRLLSNILNYDSSMKIAKLHKTVQHDYKSLQWL
jgi:hypothetical protein